MPVANGAATKREVENAVRASLRGEWIDEDRHASPQISDRVAREGHRRGPARTDRHPSLQISESVAREGAPERARPDTWAAVNALTQRQRAVVILSFWYGLSQGVESRRLDGFA